MNYFETIKCYDMEVFHLKYHQQRIANTIGKNINLLDYIYPPSPKLLKCKVLYNENEILNISFDLYKKKEIKTFKIVADNFIEYNFKYENRDEIDFHLSNKGNFDDIIILKNNLITDTSIANIAIYLNDQWYTPKKPLLYGTTRQRYIDNGILKEMNIDIKTLKKAKKFALLNAMIDFDIIDDRIL
ncbi:MAG: branched-chain amino acid aminotransferase [Arcobacter sp.]|nr:MAG: branched-chain amino acid aminotransferase [Arcobacter sp.]